MYWLLIVCVLLYFPHVLVSKIASNKAVIKKSTLAYALFIALTGSVAGLVLVLIDRAKFAFDPVTLCTSLLFCVMLAASTLVSCYALHSVPVAFVNMSGCMGVIIPSVCGILFFNEPLKVGKIAGILLFLLAAYLITKQGKGKSGTMDLRSFLLCVAVFLFEGLGSLTMQIFGQYSSADDSLFVFYSYTLESIVLIVFFIAFLSRVKRKNISEEQKPLPKSLVGYGVATGLIITSINYAITVLVSHIPSTVLFPVLRSGSLLSGAVVGSVFFKEKLSGRNILGFVFCVAAVIVLSL